MTVSIMNKKEIASKFVDIYLKDGDTAAGKFLWDTYGEDAMEVAILLKTSILNELKHRGLKLVANRA